MTSGFIFESIYNDFGIPKYLNPVATLLSGKSKEESETVEFSVVVSNWT